MADRFFEHPATVLVLTNLAYADAPWLHVKSLTAASSLVWHEMPLKGNSAHRFEQQIIALEPFLSQNWKAGVTARTGNPVYERPVVLVIYRDDHRFLLDPIIPRPGGTLADYDLVIASQPYRARAPLDFKAERVIGAAGARARPRRPPDRHPLVRPRPRHGNHSESLAERQSVHPQPPSDPQGGQARAGRGRPRSELQRLSDNRSLFRYEMHTLPSEISDSIGTSTLFAAWNAAIYVAQVEDDRVARGGRRRQLYRRHPLGFARTRRPVVLR